MGSKSKFSICRLCLSYGEVLVDIIEGEDEIGFEVKETIEDLLRVEVLAGGDLPWVVCLNCIGKLEDFSNFKFKCLTSNTAFVQRFTKPRQSTATSSNRTQAKESPSTSRAVVVPSFSQSRTFCGDSSRRVVIGSVGSDEFTEADRALHNDAGGYCSRSGDIVVTRIHGTPSGGVNNASLSCSNYRTQPQHAMVVDEEGRCAVKMEDERHLAESMGGGIVVVSTTSTVSLDGTPSTKRGTYFEAEDSTEVVHRELAVADQDEQEEGNGSKVEMYIGVRQEDVVESRLEDSSVTAGCRTSSSGYGVAADMCSSPLLSPRMMVQENASVALDTRLCAEQRLQAPMEVRQSGDKVPSGGMEARNAGSRSPEGPWSSETPEQRKRRMARERQRRFRARMSNQLMAWRRAQDDPGCAVGEHLVPSPRERQRRVAPSEKQWR